MKYWRTLTLVLTLSLGTVGIAGTALAYPMDSIHWNHRSILFFAPAHDQHVKTFVKETLMNNCQLQERDIKVIVITQDGYYKPENLFSPEEINMLTQKYRIATDSHTAVLVGKDGLEKHRWGEETNWQYITSLIDRMPLRIKEMAYSPNSRCSI
ncbi:hypothetical protein JCM19237_4512 [Photobacterium aphoticum]|uniref:DUF4174 domain-containing protein n=1 Tax=Photobacterium aphoticum TaxID=754436 RepID=A0A090QW33_9GAMM|nr:hypothetical protein JCM19237_4512 [Photobacterium aphoticum]